MALWITKGRATKGPVFGSADNFEGLGVFFDTYKNNRPGVVFPYVMAMVGDGKTPYDKNADGREHELAGCSVCCLGRHQWLGMTDMLRPVASEERRSLPERVLPTFKINLCCWNCSTSLKRSGLNVSRQVPSLSRP